jgi:hypothetical protein
MYLALMAARSFIQPKVRGDLRDAATLAVVEQALKEYQDHKSPPPGKVDQPMDWDAVKEIRG